MNQCQLFNSQNDILNHFYLAILITSYNFLVVPSTGQNWLSPLHGYEKVQNLTAGSSICQARAHFISQLCKADSDVSHMALYWKKKHHMVFSSHTLVQSESFSTPSPEFAQFCQVEVAKMFLSLCFRQTFGSRGEPYLLPYYHERRAFSAYLPRSHLAPPKIDRGRESTLNFKAGGEVCWEVYPAIHT